MVPFPMMCISTPLPTSVIVTYTAPPLGKEQITTWTWDDIAGWLTQAAEEQSHHGKIPILGYKLVLTTDIGMMFAGVGTPKTTVNGRPYFIYATHDFFKGDQFLEIENHMLFRPGERGTGLIYRDGVPLKINNQRTMQSIDSDPGYPDNIPVISGNGPIEWINRGDIVGDVVGG